MLEISIETSCLELSKKISKKIIINYGYTIVCIKTKIILLVSFVGKSHQGL